MEKAKKVGIHDVTDGQLEPPPEVSILILTHNARWYVHKTLDSLRWTKNVKYEVVVVDNASNWLLRLMLRRWHHRGWINKLKHPNYNSFFARGNNIASEQADPHAPYLLLLNSDIEVRDEAGCGD